MISPITAETFEKMVSQWAKIARFKESGSVYTPSKSGLLRRIDQLFKDKKLLKKYFPDLPIVVLDLEARVVEDKEDVLDFWKKIPNKAVVFILGADKILKEKDDKFLDNLTSLALLRPKISFLLFFHRDFTHPEFTKIFKNQQKFIQNLYFRPLYDQRDCFQFSQHLVFLWGINIPKALLNKIIRECLGSFWLLSEALRFYRDQPDKSEEIFNSEGVNWKLNLTWENFLESEKEVLKKIVRNQTNFTLMEKHSFNFLVKIGLLKKRGSSWQIVIPLLSRFIEKKNIGVDLTLDEKNRLVTKGVVIDLQFSSKERKVLKLLFKNKGRVVSRELLSEEVWTKEEPVSDWTIDQTISRLRKKLASLNIFPKIIKTVRKRGFIYE